MVKVKICGVTNYADAAMALDLGADALGFNFYTGSPRYIRPEAAAAIIRKLPPLAVIVGVFVNETTPDEVSEKARTAGVHCLQLHGDESPQFCEDLQPWSVIKALRLKPNEDLNTMASYPVNLFLVDAFDEEKFGGTGRTANWDRAVRAKSFGRIILAGGLNSRNVAPAIRVVQPYAVDVCSGVERAPGIKDRAKLQAFIEEVRCA